MDRGRCVRVTSGTFLQVLPGFRGINGGQLVSMEMKAKILEHGSSLLIICFVVVVLYLKFEELKGFLFFQLQASNSRAGAVFYSPWQEHTRHVCARGRTQGPIFTQHSRFFLDLHLLADVPFKWGCFGKEGTRESMWKCAAAASWAPYVYSYIYMCAQLYLYMCI